MEQGVLRFDRGLVASLGLSLAIVAAGSYWVFGRSPERPQARHNPSAAYGVQPEDLSRVSAISEIIVEGVVKEVYPAEWTTRNKSAPAHMEEMLTNENIQLRTPVLLDVWKVFKGRGVPGTVMFTLPGGTDGDVTVSSPFGMTLEPGQRVLVFLSRAPKKAGPWAEISPLYPQLFFVVEGANLHGPDKTVSRNRVMAKLGFGG
ncbi:MAG TPA: hypothetical protein VHC97_07735 [Thermoanaerobaculia bacterium]|jgi:hypothetical protein|nr:hypothetical protein [Thermoanaerobaculia bacterium]